MNRFFRFALVLVGTGLLSGCDEEITSALDVGLIPVEAVTSAVDLPFGSFAVDLEAWGGYGQPFELLFDIVAAGFEGSLDARVLNSLGEYPKSATVRDSTGAFVTDSILTFLGGTFVAQFDTVTSVSDGPVTLAVGVLPQPWDLRTVSWTMAVDSVGDQRPWTEAGGGPITPLATAEWDPEEADSVVFEVDSAAVALLNDTLLLANGIRLDALTEGSRLDLTRFVYSVDTRPSVNPDTILSLGIPTEARTFIYQPFSDVPADEIRVGGVPAWRTVFTLELPDSLYGPPELCAQAQCPLALTPSSLISASLVLTTRAPSPAFQPRDTLQMDVRTVLEPTRLPKSPLGSSLVGGSGIRLPPELFDEEAGAEVEVPLGPYIQNLLNARGDSTATVPATLALLSSFEPLSLFFASFHGPGSPSEPELRLIVTLAEDILIR